MESDAVEQILHHLAHVSVGDCLLDEETVLACPDESLQRIFAAILFLHEDLTYRQQEEQKAHAALKKTHDQLVEASRIAGMAEVATNVLHNVGNVFNSVGVSASTLSLMLETSKKSRLRDVVELLHRHRDQLGPFFSEDARGRKVLEYLDRLADAVAAETAEMLVELERINKGIEHARHIISAQQSYARSPGSVEKVVLRELVDTALELAGGALELRGIEVQKSYPPRIVSVVTDRHRVLQILSNLVRNARDAMETSEGERRLHIAVDTVGDAVRVRVADTGCGFDEAARRNLFRHGFTTKRKGHGFGLHASHNSASELGGSLTATSDGPGRGATFTLTLPIERPHKSPSPREESS